MRCDEIMALEWRDLDFTNRQLSVARSEWKGHATAPKGGRVRHVPLIEQLTEALKVARHLRGPRVIDEVSLGFDVERDNKPIERRTGLPFTLQQQLQTYIPALGRAKCQHTQATTSHHDVVRQPEIIFQKLQWLRRNV